MLPYNLLFKIGSKAVGSFMTKRAEKSERKHQIALQEMQTGNERAKRNGSLILDLVLGAFILAPLGILAYATFYGDMTMLKKVEFYFEQLKNIPEVYLYLIFIVVGGNYGISVTNLLSNKKFKKMTISAFDPSLLSNYDQPKYLLHFQWKNSDIKIYRYALVEEIDITKIDHRLKLKQDEVGLSQQEIWEKKYK